MDIIENKLYYCDKCHKTMSGKDFYTSKNLEKYPNDGKLNLCKKCITMHVDNWNPDTYTWILQECDVPYIPDEWFGLMQKYAANPEKITGMTIIGRYLSKMKLKQWSQYHWKDNEVIQEILDAKKRQAMQVAGYEAGEIELKLAEEKPLIPEKPASMTETPGAALPFVLEEEEDDIDLTDEDIMYLKIKWGKNYRKDEWVKLEQLYNEMLESYDIQTASHIDNLKLLCKTSLKCHQLVDIGDVDGFQKMEKTYNSLLKSGNFSAAQNKEDRGEGIDAIGQIVAICEKEGFIPRYYVNGPQDAVDKVILDMQKYTHSLVTEEMGLGDLIEGAVKQIEKDKKSIGKADDDIFDDEDIELQDKDYEEFHNMVDELAAADEEAMMGLGDEDGTD